MNFSLSDPVNNLSQIYNKKKKKKKKKIEKKKKKRKRKKKKKKKKKKKLKTKKYKGCEERRKIKSVCNFIGLKNNKLRYK